MLKNYLKIAYRNLLKHKIFSLVNLLGFSLGFIAAIFIALYVADELNFDRYHSKADQIYRITETVQSENGERQVARIAAQVAPTVAENFHEVEEAVRMTILGRLTLGYNEFRDYEDLLIADPSFFQIFDGQFIAGNAETALQEPYAIVLTESLAKKYFGDESPLGKSMYNNRFGREVTVTAVMKDFPSNAHFRPTLIFSASTLFSIDSFKQFVENDWSSNLFATYLLLRKDVDPALLANSITSYANEHRLADQQKNKYHLQALSDIHFYSSKLENDYAIHGNIGYVYVFSAIGGLILLIAFFNYINLSTARAMKRAKEVGLRKTIGASKKQLVYQFMGESLLIVLLTLVMAMTLVQLLMPSFNILSGKDLQMNLFSSSTLLLFLLIGLVSGALAGTYPAFYLSKMKPSLMLKQQSGPRENSLLRQLLVVTQFAIAIVLITATTVIYQQMNFIRNSDLGYNRQQLVTVDINSLPMREKYESVKATFQHIPAIESVTATTRVPGEWKNMHTATVNKENASIEFLFTAGDEDFLPTYDIKLVQGRNFRHTHSDSAKVLLNETAVQVMGLTHPIGQLIEVTHFNQEKLEQPFLAEVIGVIQDVHFESVREKVAPTLISYYQNPFYPIDYYTLRIGTQKISETIAAIEAVTQDFDPENPLEYHFLDDKFEELYRADTKRGEIFTIAAILAIVIACMGLFGLTNLAVEQRTREVGIRKVLGADVLHITWLISSKFIRLVTIAFLIAAPFAWWATQNWLSEFAYHIDMSLSFLLIAGMIVLGIALFTVSFQTIQAALANPVKSLRYE